MYYMNSSCIIETQTLLALKFIKCRIKNVLNKLKRKLGKKREQKFVFQFYILCANFRKICCKHFVNYSYNLDLLVFTSYDRQFYQSPGSSSGTELTL